MTEACLVALVTLVALLCAPGSAQEAGAATYSVRVTVTSDLPCPMVPMDPTIDFASLIEQAGLPGRLDPNSIVVVDTASGQAVPHAVNEDFAYADKGRIEWVIQDPTHKEFEVRFKTAPQRPQLEPASNTPLIGVGDLLRYNAGEPRPILMPYLSRLIDLNGDGKRDLVGCWNYAYRPGWPWDGVICYPRVGDDDAFLFGDLTRIRYVDSAGSDNFKHLSRIYMHADFADLNGNGRPDLVYSPSGGDQVSFFLNSGDRDAGGMPIFVASGSAPRHTSKWDPCRAVDLNQDGAVDLVVGGTYLRNTNPEGWPMEFAEPARLNVGDGACFYDVDGDGLLDAVCLVDGPAEEPRAKRVAWQRNLGGDPPEFGEPQILEDIDCFWACHLAAVNEGPERGILVQHNIYQRVSFYEQVASEGDRPRFRLFGDAQSESAVLCLSDQAWPEVCDWDGDGDWDLLVGGGYGWPRIVLNNGASDRPALAEAKQIMSEGEPIRLLRDEILDSEHWHNMGYPYPAYVDWDGDGLPDLILPNETNRIFWYKNIGTRQEPRFGERRQIICEGFPDSPEKRAESARLAGDKSTPNQPYPYEKGQPFFWRTGAGFGDLNGDGLMDMITHDGETRKLTLFAQYRDESGELRLRKDRLLKLSDGRLIDDAVVGRAKHWTESFRCVDWDGDGLIDIIYNCAGTEASKGSIYLLRNCGTPTDPVFEPPVTLCCFGVPIKVTAHGPNAAVADLNGDGRPDLLTCVEWSVYPFYSHAAIEMKERPTFEIGPVQTR